MSFRKVDPVLAVFVGFILWFLAQIPAAILGYLFRSAFNVYWYDPFLIIMLLGLYGFSALRLGGWRSTPYLFLGLIFALIVSYFIASIWVSMLVPP
jgi:hypothetical protein